MKQKDLQIDNNLSELLEILPLVNWSHVVKDGVLGQVLKLMALTAFYGLLYLFFVKIPDAWRRYQLRKALGSNRIRKP